MEHATLVRVNLCLFPRQRVIGGFNVADMPIEILFGMTDFLVVGFLGYGTIITRSWVGAKPGNLG